MVQTKISLPTAPPANILSFMWYGYFCGFKIIQPARNPVIACTRQQDDQSRGNDSNVQRLLTYIDLARLPRRAELPWIYLSYYVGIVSYSRAYFRWQIIFSIMFALPITSIAVKKT
jgi:hypothetical protein